MPNPWSDWAIAFSRHKLVYLPVRCLGSAAAFQRGSCTCVHANCWARRILPQFSGASTNTNGERLCAAIGWLFHRSTWDYSGRMFLQHVGSLAECA